MEAVETFSSFILSIVPHKTVNSDDLELRLLHVSERATEEGDDAVRIGRSNRFHPRTIVRRIEDEQSDRVERRLLSADYGTTMSLMLQVERRDKVGSRAEILPYPLEHLWMGAAGAGRSVEVDNFSSAASDSDWKEGIAGKS